MKHSTIKTLAITIALLFSVNLQAEIKLIHTFENMVYFGTGLIDGEANYINELTSKYIGCFYYTEVDPTNNTYSEIIYNGNFELKSSKTYQFIPPTGYQLTSVSPSSNTFNNNDDTEFIVVYNCTEYTASNNKQQLMHLYNEDGELIYDFGYGYNISWYSLGCLIDKKCYALVYRMYYDENNELCKQTKVYLTEGIPSDNIANQENTIQKLPHPNPSCSIINIPYNTENGNTTISIFNNQGQLVEHKQLSNNSTILQLNVSNYPKGIYHYTINGKNHTFIVN